MDAVLLILISTDSVVLNSIIPPHAGTNAGYVYDPFQACQVSSLKDAATTFIIVCRYCQSCIY